MFILQTQETFWVYFNEPGEHKIYFKRNAFSFVLWENKRTCLWQQCNILDPHSTQFLKLFLSFKHSLLAWKLVLRTRSNRYNCRAAENVSASLAQHRTGMMCYINRRSPVKYCICNILWLLLVNCQSLLFSRGFFSVFAGQSSFWSQSAVLSLQNLLQSDCRELQSLIQDRTQNYFSAKPNFKYIWQSSGRIALQFSALKYTALKSFNPNSASHLKCIWYQW